MYLAILVITTGLAGMSGLWYALPLAWAGFTAVYSQVIPFEEAYLQGRFGDDYRAYCAAVPRLVPTFRGYPKRQGRVRLREGLANEAVAWVVLWALIALYGVL